MHRAQSFPVATSSAAYKTAAAPVSPAPIAPHLHQHIAPLAATSAGTSAIAIFVFRNGAGDPDVTTPISLTLQISTGYPSRAIPRSTISRPIIFRFGPPDSCTTGQRIAADEIALVELQPMRQPRLEHVDVLGNLVPIQAHSRLQPQRIARAQPAGPNAELRARFHQRVPHLHRGGFVGRDVNLEAVFAASSRCARSAHWGCPPPAPT